MCGNGAEWERRSQMHQLLGKLPLGKHQLIFDSRVLQGEGFGSLPKDATVLSDGVMKFDLEIVPTLADAMPPVDTPAMNEAVKHALGICTTDWGNGERLAILVFDGDAAANPAFETTAFSLQIDWKRDGVVQSTSRFLVHRYDSTLGLNSIYKNDDPIFAFATLKTLTSKIADDPVERAHWSMKVTGTDYEILPLWHADTQWAGSFEVSIDDAMKTEGDRMQGKRRSFMWMP